MSHPRTVRSAAISASAGYGKTQILCMRLLAILLADPRNINRTAAMTFTVAAAGEILERLLELAAGGAADDAGFEKFKSALTRSGEEKNLLESDAEGFRDLTRPELSGLLVQLCRRLNELEISTLDSFMVSLAGAGAMELGFCGAPAIIDEAQGKMIVSGIIRDLFQESDQEVADLCRCLQIGHDGRTLAEAGAEMLEALAADRDGHPNENDWGKPPSDISETPRGPLAEALACCDGAHPAKKDEVYRTKLRPLLVHCAEIASAEENFTQKEIEILNVFFDVWETFPEQKPDGFKKDWDYSRCADAIRMLLSRARDILLIQAGVRTRAAYHLLTRYRDLYRRRLWERGMIRFGDLPKLLSGTAKEDLLDLQYRMNTQFKHFLIDEFQDTSRQQWQVFEPIVQDNGEADRSTTFVGDVKQAIYNWRGGDSELMGEVTENMRQWPLPYSRRSGKAICDALNMLFDQGIRRCGGDAIPDPVRRRWEANFLPHQPKEDKPGCFELILPMPETPQRSSPNDFLEDAAALIAERLGKPGLNIRENRLTCAILVRKNQQGVKLKEILSAMDGFSSDDFVWEGDESIAADRVNRGLLALLYYLQHPGDTTSAEILRMDPGLRELLPEDSAAFREAQAQLMELGLTGFLSRCLRKIGSRSDSRPGDAANALLAAARKFEAAVPGCDTAAFRDFAGAQKRSDADLAGKIRIMTVHHSKGLTFDVTFVPFCNYGNFSFIDCSGVLSGPGWLLYEAQKAALTSEMLRKAIVDRCDREKFEILCTCYVALTRARHEVCVILPGLSREKRKYFHPELSELKKFKERFRIAEKSQTAYAAEDLLHDAFFFDDDAFPIDRPLPLTEIAGKRVLRRTFGDRNWFGKITAKAEPPAAELFAIPDGGRPTARPIRIAPSRTADDGGGFRFPSRTDTPNSGTEFGTAVHAFFEKIKDIRTFMPPADTPETILAHFDACRRAPEIVGLLSPDGCEVWRERRFDIILQEDGVKKFVSGCFDRVRIRRDPSSGRATSADIIDYKSNDLDASGIPAAVEHYRPQMELYARVLARLLGIGPDQITGYLIFTKTGIVRRVERKAQL